MEKPDVLYHGSAHKSIERIEPRAKKTRDPHEGPKVFASPDKRLASAFMIDVSDSWANSGMYNGIPYLVVGDRARFEALDQGGAIYHLPSHTFETDPHKGMGISEWTSAESVTPFHKEDHHSALMAMLEHGVQVYFVDPDTYTAWRTAPDHGFSIIQSLESENQRLNINPISFV